MSFSLRLHGLYSPWNSPGQNTGAGNLSHLQRIFPTQGSNPGLLHCRQILYQLSHQVVKDAARNLTNRVSRIHQHLSNSWENWLSNWNWMPWVLSFLGPLLLLTLILTFGPCLMCLFSKFLQDPLQAFTKQTIHELLLTQSDYQKLRPHTNPHDPHSRLFLSYPHNAPVPQEAVTEDWPSPLILNQKG